MKITMGLPSPVRKPIGRVRLLIEALLVAALVHPAIRFLNFIGEMIGLNYSAFRVQGVFIAFGVGAFFMMLSHTTWRDIGWFRPKSWGLTLFWALLGAFVILVIYDPIAEHIFPHIGLPYKDLTPQFIKLFEGQTSRYISYMVFIVWGSAAFGEELLARGFLFHRMEQFFRKGPAPWLLAAIGQAIIFGAFHYFYGLAGAIMAGIQGFLLAMIFLLSGRNLAAPILAHGFVNSAYITSYYLGASLPFGI